MAPIRLGGKGSLSPTEKVDPSLCCKFLLIALLLLTRCWPERRRDIDERDIGAFPVQ
jgi:hypothetical protein